MISSSNVEKHNAFQWFQAQCWKTQCFSMISSSNVEQHDAFQLFQAQMSKNTMLFNDFKLTCWTASCFSTFDIEIIKKHYVFLMWNHKKHRVFLIFGHPCTAGPADPAPAGPAPAWIKIPAPLKFQLLLFKITSKNFENWLSWAIGHNGPKSD